MRRWGVQVYPRLGDASKRKRDDEVEDEVSPLGKDQRRLAPPGRCFLRTDSDLPAEPALCQLCRPEVLAQMAGTHLKYAFTMPCTQLLDSKISGRILKAAREQQQEIDAEDFEDEREQTRAKVRWAAACSLQSGRQVCTPACASACSM